MPEIVSSGGPAGGVLHYSGVSPLLSAPLAEATDRALGLSRPSIDPTDAEPPRPLTYDSLLSSHGPPRKNAGNPRGRRTSWAWGAVCALLAALFLFKGLLPTGTTESPFPPGVQSVAARSAPELATIPIEQIRVGLRVPGLNPELDSGQRIEPDPDPATLRRLELRAPKTDGTWADVVLLRPLSWLREQQAEPGRQVSISVPECGIDGTATVLTIRECPPIPPGPGRVVTGTFRHASAHVLDLQIDGLAEPIGATANHPFWSEDRRQFLRADELKPGERLRTLHGTARLAAAVPRTGTEPVYNLEVQTAHVYHVGSGGVLVHNGRVCKSKADQDNKPPVRRISNRKLKPPTKRGNAPIGEDGHPIELHHNGQQPDSPLIEMTRTDHRLNGNFPKKHTNTGQSPSEIDRAAWRKQQKGYWRAEWDRGRFKNM